VHVQASITHMIRVTIPTNHKTTLETLSYKLHGLSDKLHGLPKTR